MLWLFSATLRICFVWSSEKSILSYGLDFPCWQLISSVFLKYQCTHVLMSWMNHISGGEASAPMANRIKWLSWCHNLETMSNWIWNWLSLIWTHHLNVSIRGFFAFLSPILLLSSKRIADIYASVLCFGFKKKD